MDMGWVGLVCPIRVFLGFLNYFKLDKTLKTFKTALSVYTTHVSVDGIFFKMYFLWRYKTQVIYRAPPFTSTIKLYGRGKLPEPDIICRGYTASFSLANHINFRQICLLIFTQQPLDRWRHSPPPILYMLSSVYGSSVHMLSRPDRRSARVWHWLGKMTDELQAW